MDDRSKNHHFVPRSLLKNFSVDGKKKHICIFDKLECRSFTNGIDKTGSENYFNSIRSDFGEFNFEKVFDHVDGILASLVKKIVQNRSISNLNEREFDELILIICIQYVRVKIWRTTGEHMIESANEFLAEATKGMDANPQFVDVPGAEEQKIITLKSVLNIEEYHKVIAKKDIYLLDFSTVDKSLYISDNPVVVTNTLPFGDVGLDEVGVELYFPLSKDLAISAICPSLRKKMEQAKERLNSKSKELFEILQNRGTLSANEDNLEYLNHLQVAQSSRFVYCDNSNFSLVERILDQNENLSSVKSKVSLQKGPSEYKNMPYGEFVVLRNGSDYEVIQIGNVRDGEQLIFFTPHIRVLQEWKAKYSDIERLELIRDKKKVRMMRDVKIVSIDSKAYEVSIEPSNEAIKALLKMVKNKKK
jgi:hypothetical protein